MPPQPLAQIPTRRLRMPPCCCGVGSLRTKTWLTLASHRTTETSSEIQQVNKSFRLSHKQKHLNSRNTCRTSPGNIMGLSGWRHWVFPAQPPFVAATSSPTNAATAIGSDPNSSASDAALLLRRGQSAQENLADTDKQLKNKSTSPSPSHSLSHSQKHLNSRNTCRTSPGNIMGLSGWRHWVFPAQPPFVAATSSPTNAATAIGSDPNSSAWDAALLLRRGQSAQENLADTDKQLKHKSTSPSPSHSLSHSQKHLNSRNTCRTSPGNIMGLSGWRHWVFPAQPPFVAATSSPTNAATAIGSDPNSSASDAALLLRRGQSAQENLADTDKQLKNKSTSPSPSHSLSHSQKHLNSRNTCRTSPGNIMGLSGWRHWVFPAQPPFVAATSSPTNAATAIGSDPNSSASDAALLLRRGQSAQENLADTDKQLKNKSTSPSPSHSLSHSQKHLNSRNTCRTSPGNTMGLSGWRHWVFPAQPPFVAATSSPTNAATAIGSDPNSSASDAALLLRRGQSAQANLADTDKQLKNKSTSPSPSHSLSHSQKHLNSRNTCRTSPGNIMGLSGWRHWVFPAQAPFVAATSSPTNAATAIGSDPNSSASDAALLLRRGQSAQANLADTDKQLKNKSTSPSPSHSLSHSQKHLNSRNTCRTSPGNIMGLSGWRHWVFPCAGPLRGSNLLSDECRHSHRLRSQLVGFGCSLAVAAWAVCARKPG